MKTQLKSMTLKGLVTAGKEVELTSIFLYSTYTYNLR